MNDHDAALEAEIKYWQDYDDTNKFSPDLYIKLSLEFMDDTQKFEKSIQEDFDYLLNQFYYADIDFEHGEWPLGGPDDDDLEFLDGWGIQILPRRHDIFHSLLILSVNKGFPSIVPLWNKLGKVDLLIGRVLPYVTSIGPIDGYGSLPENFDPLNPFPELPRPGIQIGIKLDYTLTVIFEHINKDEAPRYMKETDRDIVVVFLFSSDGYLLLGKNNDDDVDQGKWFVPAVSVNANESKIDTLNKASLKEIGVDISSFEAEMIEPPIIGKDEKDMKDVSELAMADMTFYTYIVKANKAASDINIKCDDDLMSASWHKVKALTKLKLTPLARQNLQRIGLV